MSMHVQGIFDTKLCHIGRELDHSVSKLSNSLGSSRHPALGENIDKCIIDDRLVNYNYTVSLLFIFIQTNARKTSRTFKQDIILARQT